MSVKRAAFNIMIFFTPTGEHAVPYQELLKKFESETTLQEKVSARILNSLLKGSTAHIEHFESFGTTPEDARSILNAFEEVGSFIEGNEQCGGVIVQRLSEKNTAKLNAYLSKTPVKT
ncbi:MAG: hypothetical protein ACKKL6_01655 [Candidatus Komeilibacteria bacterium]